MRWQYLILWRYGPLGLAVAGLAMLGFGASGAPGVPISLSLLPLGLAALIAGVVLPRIEGKFTAGTSGVSAELLAVHKLDTLMYSASAPALAVPEDARFHDKMPTGINQERTTDPIKLGDVWDALEHAGFGVATSGLGKSRLDGPQGRSIVLHARELLGWAAASNDLLAHVASWGVRPVASNKYPVPPNVDPNYAIRPYSGVLLPTDQRH